MQWRQTIRRQHGVPQHGCPPASEARSGAARAVMQDAIARLRRKRFKYRYSEARNLLRYACLAFAGLMAVGAMAMACYELFSLIEKHTTGWAHRGSQSE